MRRGAGLAASIALELALTNTVLAAGATRLSARLGHGIVR